MTKYEGFLEYTIKANDTGSIEMNDLFCNHFCFYADNTFFILICKISREDNCRFFKYNASTLQHNIPIWGGDGWDSETNAIALESQDREGIDLCYCSQNVLKC